MANTETYADFGSGNGLGIVEVPKIAEVPKSEIQVSADLRDEADKIIDLANALADCFRRTVVVLWTNDKEVVVEPALMRRLDS